MVERKPGFIPGVTMQLLLHLAFSSPPFGGFRGGILIPPRPSQVEALEPGRLQQKLPDKPRIVDQVSAPQAARLGSQPEQPLQPITLHPYRRLTYPARVKVERRSNRDQDRRVEKWPHTSNPEVLLGRAHADPNDVCVSGIDCLRDGWCAELVERRERWFDGAGDLELRETRGHHLGQALG